jgi:hypothetical protein
MSRRALAARAAPALLVLLLAGATLLPLDEALRLESGDAAVAERWGDAVAALPDDADVLVAFDPDLGTYAEIRPTVRVALAELLARPANLAFVSLTPEGRALALAELARLERAGAAPLRIVDFGFLPGAEAALVHLTRTFPDPTAEGTLGLRIAAGGFAEVEAILVVGGNDLGPRSWVEQVLPRVGDVPILAVAPTILLPELQPYVATGQLAALVATPRDGAAYRQAADLGTGARLVSPEDPSVAALLLGVLVAVLVLGQAIVAGLARPSPAEREPR